MVQTAASYDQRICCLFVRDAASTNQSSGRGVIMGEPEIVIEMRILAAVAMIIRVKEAEHI
jgi:hypothetical protein